MKSRFVLQGRLRVKFSHRTCVCNLLRNFVCLISTDMFPRKFVDYETSSCAYSHTKRRVSARFLTYKDMSLRYI